MVHLTELFDHYNDLFAQFSPQQGQSNVVLILVSIADNEAVVPLVHGQSDHQLGFGTGLQTVGKLGAGIDNLLHDLA